MKLSIVTSLYNSAPFVTDFYSKATAAAKKFALDDYEIIFVDDGSPDNSAEIVRSLLQKDEHVVLVELSKNFGHYNAALCGVLMGKGDFVFYLDCDLEEDPMLLEKYYEEMVRADADIVYGMQDKRQGDFFKRISGALFYGIFNFCSEVKVLPNITSAMLGKRSFVDAMRHIGEKNLFMPANLAWLGFKTSFLKVSRTMRKGKSNYTLLRMLHVAMNAITSFTAYPLQMIFLLGLVLSLCFGAMGFYMLIKKLLFPYKVFFGYASIIVSIWFLGGVLILFIGIIGIYLAKIFNEVKNRPQYVIRKVYRKE
jgi:putative glycosyltransferase